MTNWHAISKEEVLEKLRTNESGLSFREAGLRANTYGKNELRQTAKISPLVIFLQEFRSVLIIILLLAAAFSFLIKHYIDFSVIIVIVFLNAGIGFFQQYKAEKTIMEMKNLLVPRVKVFRQGALLEISSAELVPGDIIQLSEGDKIMADCRILHENNLEINEAILTGESFAQRKGSGVLKQDTELANRENMIYMGTLATRGNCRAVVVATGMASEFGKIAEMVQAIKPEKTPIEKKFDEFSKKVAIVGVALALIAVLIGILRGENYYEMLFTGVALAISIIPEGLPAVIAITLAFAIRRMQKHNSLVRKLPAAETLGRTTVICVDKTGTLTEEEMTVTKLYCRHNYFTIKDHSFYNDRNKKIWPDSVRELELLLKIGIMCNNARVEKDGKKVRYVLGDPTEKALVMSADKAGLFKKQETEKEARLMEYSFSSKRKLMSIVRENEHSIISYVKGAPDVILKKCAKEFVSGRAVPLTDVRREELMEAYKEMAADALRVLGFAFKEVSRGFNQESAETGLVFVGFQGIMDPPRKEIKPAIKECLTAGIKIKMLTGDSLITAQAVSKMIGLDGGSIEESELEKLSEEEFDAAVIAKTIFARITPETKLRIVQSLKKQKEIVAVTGDGVNDILALKEAHIGVAMGIRGSDIARDVSDIILIDDNFSSIVRAVREGRRVYDNLKKAIKFNFSANIGEIFLVVSALLCAIPLPLTPLAILWMNLITDTLPSLSLSVEKPEKDIMDRRPREADESLMKHIIGFVIAAGIISSAVTILIFLFYYKIDLEKARTIALTTMVFCEFSIALVCRSKIRNIWQMGWFTNKPLIYSVLAGILLQVLVIYFAPLSGIFGFTPLSAPELLIAFALSFAPFIFLETWKRFKQKNPSKR